VLFVHGIGEQKEGETLAAFGEPLVEWMREWVIGHGAPRSAQEERRASGIPDDGVEVTYASLFPSRRYSADPAHAEVEIRITNAQQKQRSQRWLFAEGWWGEQVLAPSVFDLVGWLFSRGVWVAFVWLAERAWQFTHPRYEEPDTWRERILRALDITRWRYVAWPYAIFWFLLLAIGLQILLVLAWIVALLPIPVIRRYIAVGLQLATLILGDSYGLVANETQRGAILTRFGETVGWLKARCDRVVIVAHSQGTAVVHAAIQSSFIAPPPLLITFGSGLAKLSQLRMGELTYPGFIGASAWIVPAALATALLLVWDRLGFGTIAWIETLTWTVGFAGLFCLLAAWFAWFKTRVDERRLPAASGQAGRWIDLYASSDPVPQGPLSVHLPKWNIVSERIINRRSVLGDHTTYWQNKPEFVTRVVAELDRESPVLGIPPLQSDAEYEHAVVHHHRTIFALSSAFWITAISLVAIGLQRFESFASAGKAVIEELEASGFDTVAGYLSAPRLFLEWGARKWTGGSVPDAVSQFGYWSVIFIAGVIVAYLWWKAIAALLVKWDAAKLADFVDHHRVKLWGPYGTWIVWPFMILIALVLPVTIVFAIQTQSNAGNLFLRLIALVVAVELGFFMLLSAVQSTTLFIRRQAEIIQEIVDTFVSAAAPGGGDRAASHGWGSWTSMVVVFLVLLVIGTLLAVGMEELTGNAQFRSVFVALPCIAAAVLLTIRLFRLAAQRRYEAWIAAALASVPLGAATWLVFVAPEETISDPVLPASGFAAMCAIALYAAVDRWLPVRSRTALARGITPR